MERVNEHFTAFMGRSLRIAKTFPPSLGAIPPNIDWTEENSSLRRLKTSQIAMVCTVHLKENELLTQTLEIAR